MPPLEPALPVPSAQPNTTRFAKPWNRAIRGSPVANRFDPIISYQPSTHKKKKKSLSKRARDRPVAVNSETPDFANTIEAPLSQLASTIDKLAVVCFHLLRPHECRLAGDRREIAPVLARHRVETFDKGPVPSAIDRSKRKKDNPALFRRTARVLARYTPRLSPRALRASPKPSATAQSLRRLATRGGRIGQHGWRDEKELISCATSPTLRVPPDFFIVGSAARKSPQTPASWEVRMHTLSRASLSQFLAFSARRALSREPRVSRA